MRSLFIILLLFFPINLYSIDLNGSVDDQILSLLEELKSTKLELKSEIEENNRLRQEIIDYQNTIIIITEERDSLIDYTNTLNNYILGLNSQIGYLSENYNRILDYPYNPFDIGFNLYITGGSFNSAGFLFNMYFYKGFYGFVNGEGGYNLLLEKHFDFNISVGLGYSWVWRF